MDWRWQFRNRIRTADELTGPLGLRRKERRALGEVARAYHAAATPYYFSLIRAGDPLDPIRLQCIPDSREIASPGGLDDPLEEQAHSPVPGLIHRFRDRCLVLATNRCAVYCRHCNRRRLWREPALASSTGRASALACDMIFVALRLCALSDRRSLR